MNEPLLQSITVMHKSFSVFRRILSGLLITCLAIRFLIKDGIGALSVVYYLTPLPILAVFSFTLGLIWLLSKRLQFAGLYFMLTIVCLLAWSHESFSLSSRAPAPGNLKLFFWNAAGNKNSTEIANHIHGFNADLIGIVESGINKRAESTWRSIFTNYTVEVLPSGMALITKGEILSKERGSLGGCGRFNLLKVALNGEQFHVLLVDIDGDPFQSRSPAFEQLATMLRAYAQASLIVMGDFNTPLGSVLFESFRQNLTHAFESGGVGFAETWPLPMPVLAIDHIWVSKNIKVVSCNLNGSRFSDHRSVVANIDEN